MVAAQLVDLQPAEPRIDDRVETDAGTRVVGELVDAIAVSIAGTGRRDLHHHVRRHASRTDDFIDVPTRPRRMTVRQTMTLRRVEGHWRFSAAR